MQPFVEQSERDKERYEREFSAYVISKGMEQMERAKEDQMVEFLDEQEDADPMQE
jgi:hypothetical protein